MLSHMHVPCIVTLFIKLFLNYRLLSDITIYVIKQEARAAFRASLTESTQGLNAISKKLGSTIEKARPYYDARQKAKEVC